MKTKSKVMSVIMIAMLTTITGCTSGGKVAQPIDTVKTGVPAPKVDGSIKGETTIKEGALEYTIIKAESLPPKLTESLNKVSSERGFVVIKATEGISTVCIGTGEKASGGHSIAIKSITNSKGISNIIIEEVKPAPSEFSTMQITYPSILINVKGLEAKVQVTTVDKQVLKGISLEPTTGKPSGKLDGRLNIQAIEGAIFKGKVDAKTIKATVNGEEKTLVTDNLDFMMNFSKVKEGDKVRLFYVEKEKGILELMEIIVLD